MVRGRRGRHGDRRGSDARRFQDDRHRRTDFRRGEDAPGAGAHRRHQGHHRLRVGARFEVDPGADRRRPLPRDFGWQRPAADRHQGDRDRPEVVRNRPLSVVPPRPESVRDGLRHGAGTRSHQRWREDAELGRGRVRRAGGTEPRYRLLVVAGRSLHRRRARRRKPGGDRQARRHRCLRHRADRAALSCRRNQERDRRPVRDDSRRTVPDQGRPRQRSRLLPRPRRLGEGRQKPLRPALEPRPEAARHAAHRSGDRPLNAAVLGNLADLGEPHRELQAAEGRQPDLVVGAERLFAPLPLAGGQMDPADAWQLGRREGRRRR